MEAGFFHDPGDDANPETGINVILGAPTLAGAQQADRPNVVLILADDLGYTDISPFGSEISTPNIARLAAEGLSFTNYHTAANCARPAPCC